MRLRVIGRAHGETFPANGQSQCLEAGESLHVYRTSIALKVYSGELKGSDGEEAEEKGSGKLQGLRGMSGIWSLQYSKQENGIV